MKLIKHILLIIIISNLIACTSVKQAYIPDVVYGHKDGMALFYDVFKPTVKSNGAAIIYMVSGGWFSTWQDPEQRQERLADMTGAGYTVFAVHHGSAPRYFVPEAYSDVSRAVRHIRLHAGDYGIDPNRMGVTGGSAGGHLSLMIGNDSDEGIVDAEDPLMRVSNRVAAVVSYFPPVDIRPMAGRNSERFPALNFEPEGAAAISPILFVSPGDPPTLLIHGDADTLVPISNSERIYAAFKEADVATNFITIEGGDHGFRNPDHRQAAGAARLEWFNQYLLP
jgi:acetyl esterase/lipase